MKLTFQSTAILTVLLATGITGCLKDKAFDEDKYGIQITEKAGIAFPQAADSVVQSAIRASAEPATIQGPLITLETTGTASSDVAITLVEAPQLVLRHDLAPLPAGSYSVSTMSPVIEAGTNFTDEVKLVIPNSLILDPDLIYGIGFEITAVSGGGTQIAKNQKFVVLAVAIKNRFDGVYTLRLYQTGWAAYSIADGVSDEYGDIELVTTGSSTVIINNTNVAADSRALHPLLTGGLGVASGTSVLGAVKPQFSFDLTSNAFIAATNLEPDDGRGRVFEPNAAVTDSHFDPVTRNIYMSYALKQIGRPNLVFKDTLLFKEDRE
ncbi:MAG: DUF1735 domain-containing protein [Chitinophagaceae bacterium]